MDNPHKDGITLEVECPFKDCGHVWRIGAYQAQSGRVRPEENSARCPGCGRFIFVDWDGDVFRPRDVMLIVVIGGMIVPAVILDKFAWGAMNAASVYLQQLTGLSKWWLSLVLWVLGCALFPVFDSHSGRAAIPWGFFDAAIWSIVGLEYLVWAYRKAVADDDGESAMTLYDAVKLRNIRIRRVAWIMLGIPMGLMFLLTIRDGWIVPFFVAHGALYWMDSDYIPPDRRYLFDMSRKWVFGEG